MKPETFLKVSGPGVVHEDFGDEVVAVDLEKGHYYSFNSTGAEIWSRVSRGGQVRDLIAWARETFSGEPPDLEAEVLAFLERLQEEALIASFPAPEGNPGPTPGREVPGEKRAFSVPKMEKFTDMEDLLMLDPIHEVDDAGWPHPQGGGTKE